MDITKIPASTAATGINAKLGKTKFSGESTFGLFMQLRCFVLPKGCKQDEKYFYSSGFAFTSKIRK